LPLKIIYNKIAAKIKIQGMIFIKTSTLLLCCLLAASIGFAIAELSAGKTSIDTTDTQILENNSVREIHDLYPSEPSNHKALTPARPTQNINLKHTSLNSKELKEEVKEEAKEELAKLKETLRQAKAVDIELQEKYEALNKTLEDLGEISPRQLAEYVFEPFDLLSIGQINATD
jgi:hypothetical protein